MDKQTHSIDQLLERVSVNPKVMVGKPVRGDGETRLEAVHFHIQEGGET